MVHLSPIGEAAAISGSNIPTICRKTVDGSSVRGAINKEDCICPDCQDKSTEISWRTFVREL